MQEAVETSEGGKNFGCLFIGIFNFLPIRSISNNLYFCLDGCRFGIGKPPVLVKTVPTKSKGFSNTLRLSDAYQVNLRFLPGVYSRGKDVDLGGWIMFRSEIGLEYHISDNWGVSVSFDHRSSGDIWPYNPGMETIQLSISKKIK